MVLDFLWRDAVTDAVAEVEEFSNVVVAAVGVPNKGQGQRTAQRLGNGTVRCPPEPTGQLAPPWGCRVELDAGQVVCRSLGIDVLQFECHSTFQEAVPGGSRHLCTASQDDDTEDCLLAQRSQGDRPQLVRDLIKPVQDHRDAGRSH